MKLRTILLNIAAIASISATARPADPALLQIHQPDGTTMRAHLHGDEHFSYFTTADNQTILEYSASGKLLPAIRNGRVLTPTAADLNLLRNETPGAHSTSARKVPAHRMATHDAQGRTTYTTIGEVHTPVLLVQFADRAFSVPEPVQIFNRMLNEEGFSEYGAKGSAKDYYTACSRGKFTPVFDIYGPITVSEPAKYYVGAGTGLSGDGKFANFVKLLEEAVPKADQDYNIDFSKYDLDGDGLIDNLFVYFAGNGQADTGRSDCIWPHQGDYRNRTAEFGYVDQVKPLELDGVKLATYATSNELHCSTSAQKPQLDGIGAFCHEYGHVIGLPDMYDVYPPITCKTPDSWTIMDHGSYNDLSTRPPLFSAYERWVCKWVEARELTPSDLDVNCILPASSAIGPDEIIRVRVPDANGVLTNESYFIEARDTKANIWDWSELFTNPGIMMWRVNFDENTWMTNQANSGKEPNIELICPDWNGKDILWPGVKAPAYEIYPDGLHRLTPATTKETLPVYMTEISYDADKMQGSFNFNSITEVPTLATTMTGVSMERNANGSFNLTFTWDDNPEADEYLLTVKRATSSGNYMIFNNLDDTPIGKVTTYTLSQLINANSKMRFQVFVRCKHRLPSSTISNVLEFKPSELESGTQLISDSDAIYTLGNDIIAPRDAEICNIQGIVSNGKNLPKGIYIVEYQGKATKVIIF